MARYCFVLMLIFLSVASLAQGERDSLFNIISKNRKDTSHIQALLELGDIVENSDSASIFYHQALRLAQGIKNNPLELDGLTGLLKLNRMINNQDSAIYYFNKGSALAHKLGNEERRANMYLDLGNVYLNNFNYLLALNEFIAGAKILDSLKTDMRGTVIAYANIGNVEFLLCKYDKAVTYIQRALGFAKEINYEVGIGYCHKKLGSIYRQQKKLDLSASEFKSALEIYTKLNDRFQISETRQSIGNLYFDLKRFNEALAEYTKSITIAKEENFENIIAHNYAAFGATYHVLNQNTKAIAYFDSLLSFSKGKYPYLEKDSYENLASIFEENNHPEVALIYQKKYFSIVDSLNKIENHKAAEEMEAKYQNTAKQNEIELLRKDQDLQLLELQKQRANTTIIVIVLISVVVISTLLINRYRVMNRIKRQAELERMRQNIARDLHDDIGSTLSSINIMSKVAMNQADNISHLQKISTYSSRMMETMSDMVWSINPVNDSVDQMLVKMKEFAGEILEPKNIPYDFQHDEAVTEIKLDVEKRKSLFLIFKEAINNAAKYSEATKVGIGLNRVNGTLQLMIHDNGKGFDASTVVRGNGLKNMAARAQAIKSTWTQVSEPGKGTTISVQVPIT